MDTLQIILLILLAAGWIAGMQLVKIMIDQRGRSRPDFAILALFGTPLLAIIALFIWGKTKQKKLNDLNRKQYIDLMNRPSDGRHWIQDEKLCQKT